MAIFRRASWINTMRRLMAGKFACAPGDPPGECENQGDCEGAGYYWGCTELGCYEDGCCIGGIPGDCENQVECEAVGYYWGCTELGCHEDGCCPGGMPDDCEDKLECEESGFSWCALDAGNECNEMGMDCNADCEMCCDSASTCQNAGCYWCDGTCQMMNPCEMIENQPECESYDCCTWSDPMCEYVPW